MSHQDKNITDDVGALTPPKKLTWLFVCVMLATPFLWTVFAFVYSAKTTNENTEVCVLHLNELNSAFIAYANKHQNKLPKAEHWVEEISPYLSNKEALRCSLDHSNNKVSYAMNINLSEKVLSDITDKESVVLLYETKNKENSPNPTGTGDDIEDLGRDKGGRGRHGSGFYRFNNFLFADGVVRAPKSFKETEEYKYVD